MSGEFDEFGRSLFVQQLYHLVTVVIVYCMSCLTLAINFLCWKSFHTEGAGVSEKRYKRVKSQNH